jgi:hypothetical protein
MYLFVRMHITNVADSFCSHADTYRQWQANDKVPSMRLQVCSATWHQPHAAAFAVYDNVLYILTAVAHVTDGRCQTGNMSCIDALQVCVPRSTSHELVHPLLWFQVLYILTSFHHMQEHTSDDRMMTCATLMNARCVLHSDTSHSLSHTLVSYHVLYTVTAFPHMQEYVGSDRLMPRATAMQ